MLVQLACAHCGDCNCDGEVNTFDIDYFVDALILPDAEWADLYPHCRKHCVADANGDFSVNTFDIDGFVQVLTTGMCPRDE